MNRKDFAAIVAFTALVGGLAGALVSVGVPVDLAAKIVAGLPVAFAAGIGFVRVFAGVVGHENTKADEVVDAIEDVVLTTKENKS